MKSRSAIMLALLLGASIYAGAASFPSGVIPFTSIYQVTAPDANGYRLVVGKGTLSAFQAIYSLPAPAFLDQAFSDASIQLAPGQYFQHVCVPTLAERQGDFSGAYGGPIIDPLSSQAFPRQLHPGVPAS